MTYESNAYTYDAANNHVSRTANSLTTYYARDAQGNTLAVYDNKNSSINWREQQLYGSSRLGTWAPNVTLTSNTSVAAWDTTGRRQYELTNHLGNVMATLTDKRLPHTTNGTAIDYYLPDLATAQDYYAFGSLQQGNTYNFTAGKNYRYGFNGKENDNEVGKGTGNQQDYGMRIYDPRVGRFLSVDPLAKSYPWFTPYSYAGNNPIRFIDLDGEETANPSMLRKAWNAIMGDQHINRMNQFITDNSIDPETVISLPNETYVISQTFINAKTGLNENTYTIFRQSKKIDSCLGIRFYSSDDDDYFLTEKQFLNTRILGNKVIPAPFVPSAASNELGAAIKGSKSAYYSFREVVGIVQVAAKEIAAWRNEIRLNVPDALGSSGDVLKKGYHVHFEKLDGLELTLKPLTGGQIGLGFLRGNGKYLKDALEVFGKALKNQSFRSSLLASLKATQETLQDAAKVLRNANEVKMANDKAHEINYLIKAVENIK